MWTANLVAFAVGFAMFGSFILMPELVQPPSVPGYGFGEAFTAAGPFLLPERAGHVRRRTTRRPPGARLGVAPAAPAGHGGRRAAYFWLAFPRDAGRDLRGLAALGLGIGLAFAAMANLVVEAVRQDQTGVATGINTIARSIGGAVGAQVAAALLAGDRSSAAAPGRERASPRPS